MRSLFRLITILSLIRSLRTLVRGLDRVEEEVCNRCHRPLRLLPLLPSLPLTSVLLLKRRVLAVTAADAASDPMLEFMTP